MYIDCKNYREDLGVCALDWDRKCHEDCTDFESISSHVAIPEQTVGIKHDGGKPRLAEMVVDFAPEMIELCKVWEFGASKYSKSNWKLVDNGIDRYTNAMLRHLLAETNNLYDDETKLLHAAHIAWNALARLHFILEETSRDE